MAIDEQAAARGYLSQPLRGKQPGAGKGEPNVELPWTPPAASTKREYEVVKMTKDGGSVIWHGGCRNCAYMIADAAKRDYPEAHVYVR